ncbi:hypothetical protein R5R35_002634 [Gryllus longicercus]|uniref:Alpha-N-acetylglucosaminidase n=1 Tax=Gryllus longicercus TaxID=2509291 RepID=A0AAN9VGV5_9ORTH
MKICRICVMISMCTCVLFILPVSLAISPHMNNFPVSTTSDDAQTAAAKAVAQRLLNIKAALFIIKVNKTISHDNKDTFQVVKDTATGKVNITGSSGVSACWGLHHYLKHYCNCHISWDGDQLLLPEELPDISISVSALDLYRYYQNVVTTSYSFVWWDWNRWQREIDWMALNGINMALAFTGQEAIWERVYLKLNLTQKDIEEHFCGPAFLAWCRMGNIRGWGGPLLSDWHLNSLQLQHNILQSMRDLGILTILPAFAGHVPKAFKRIFPDVNMTRMNTWNEFLDRYCCPYLLEPTEPLFRRVGNMFITELIAEFGTDHFYNCDTFNEMVPQSEDLVYLRNVGAAIFEAISYVDPQAIWLLQGWLFVNEATFWNQNRVQAFVTSVPLGRMIVLDLQSELIPQYGRLDSYFGQPFIWCMLHNFGGTLGLYGAAENINSGIFNARSMNGSTMVGIGLTPEGINQNYVVYDLVLDLTWRTEPVNLTLWFSSYVHRRYGHTTADVDKAWQFLKSGVYNFTGLRRVRGKYIICRRPTLRLKPWYWYNTTELKLAWDGFVSAASELSSSPLFQHDLVDVTRQALQVLGDGLYTQIVRGFQKKNLPFYQENVDLFLQLLEDINEILGTNNQFLLGVWLNSAKRRATYSVERIIYEFNARNQITLWGPLGEIRDYATKQWSGVVSDYYYPRWELFFDFLRLSLITKTPFNQTHFAIRVFETVEEPFTLDNSSYPDAPQGNSVEVARRLHSFWRNSSVWSELVKFMEPSRVNQEPISNNSEIEIKISEEDFEPHVILV